MNHLLDGSGLCCWIAEGVNWEELALVFLIWSPHTQESGEKDRKSSHMYRNWSQCLLCCWMSQIKWIKNSKIVLNLANHGWRNTYNSPITEKMTEPIIDSFPTLTKTILVTRYCPFSLVISNFPFKTKPKAWEHLSTNQSKLQSELCDLV